MDRNRFNIDNNDDIALYIAIYGIYDDNDNDVDKPMTIQVTQRQIKAILAGCHTASSTNKEASNCAADHTTVFFNPMFRPASHIIPIASPNNSVQQQHQQYQHTTINHDNMNHTVHRHNFLQWQL